MVRFFVRLVLVLVMTAGMGMGGIAAAKRYHTGTWSMPTKQDVIWLSQIVTGDPEPPRVIFLNRHTTTYTGGLDESHENYTQLIPDGAVSKVPGYSGSKRSWNRLVRCTRAKFAKYDVTITDKRPTEQGYITVHVGGRPRDLFGKKRKGMGGVAPFNGDVIPNAVVFVFSRTLGNKYDPVCDAIAHEIGHAYGLDHSYRCSDVMSYLHGCKKKRFVDADVRCGEHKRRDCHEGETHQNSHEHLLALLGPRPVATDANTAVAKKTTKSTKSSTAKSSKSSTKKSSTKKKSRKS